MELLVIRHGQSEADVLRRHEGRADYPLTELGTRQARLMARWVNKNYPPDRILSSTLQRACATAQILSGETHTDVEYLDELMEFNNGLLAGLTYEEASVKYPEPKEKQPHDKLYGQESHIEFRARAETVFSKIIHGHPKDKRIAVISHGGMINMLFRSFLKLPVGTDTYIVTGDTGIHLWRIENEKRCIIYMNSMAHLAGSGLE